MAETGSSIYLAEFGKGILIRAKKSAQQNCSPKSMLVEFGTPLKKTKKSTSLEKDFFIALSVLTCSWLTTVIYFVYQNAVSPSIEDRGKLIQIQAQLDATTNLATNLFHSAMFYAANPVYKPSLFHLSDSVLIAFITSTTVAVLGLFVTAANWLYGKHNPKKKPESDNQHAGNVPE